MLFNKESIRQRRLHFIGIGGIGMSGIAEILLNLGYTVTGSDLRESPVTERLRALGATIRTGHRADNLGDAEAVVASTAIPGSNPERVEAGRRGIPVISRGELLAELMRVKYGIAVAGSHGKTSTSSLCAAVLGAAAKDPTVVIGGRVASLGSNARLGNSDFLLVEADESDGSFLRLDPIVGVITNIDREHLDHYGSTANLLRAFEDFANSVPFYGAAIVCLDDPLAAEVARRIHRRCRTYGFQETSPGADLVASEVALECTEVAFRLRYRHEDLGQFRVRGVGAHTVRNAMAAVLVSRELEIPTERIRAGLADFRGVDRRFQKRGEEAGVTVIDDYGHHPTEIRTTLAGAASCGFSAVNVIFQPHRYSRTKDLEADFAGCFAECDRLWVVDIYSAGEDPLPGICSPKLVEKIAATGHPQAAYCGSMQQAVEAAAAAVGPGEALMTFGAGNIWMAGDEFLAKLRGRTGAAGPEPVPSESRPLAPARR